MKYLTKESSASAEYTTQGAKVANINAALNEVENKYINTEKTGELKNLVVKCESLSTKASKAKNHQKATENDAAIINAIIARIESLKARIEDTRANLIAREELKKTVRQIAKDAYSGMKQSLNDYYKKRTLKEELSELVNNARESKLYVDDSTNLSISAAKVLNALAGALKIEVDYNKSTKAIVKFLIANIKDKYPYQDPNGVFVALSKLGNERNFTTADGKSRKYYPLKAKPASAKQVISMLYALSFIKSEHQPQIQKNIEIYTETEIYCPTSSIRCNSPKLEIFNELKMFDAETAKKINAEEEQKKFRNLEKRYEAAKQNVPQLA